MKYKYRLLAASFLVLFFLLLSINSCLSYPHQDSIPVLKYEIIEPFPHDPGAFTQGLVWQDGFLYEGTGLYGESSLRKVELETGMILKQYNLPDDFFGEGIAIFKNRIYQLTWKAKTGFIYQLDTFDQISSFTYSYEGWGITHDGKNLIISDGTAILHFVDPSTMEEIKKIEVHENGVPVNQINELEYINGKIYANIWQTEQIAVIEPQSGKVIAWLDLSGILNFVDMDESQKIDVLNGIAYDSESDCLFITGKLWPVLFQMKTFKR